MNSDHFSIQLDLAKRQREAGDLIAAANTLMVAYDLLLSHYDEAIEHCERLLEELHQAKLKAHREHRT
jgi:allophanate hydrolase subunit 1